MSKIGNGLSRMIRWNVARALPRVDAEVNELGRDAFISEARTSSLLDTSYGRGSELENQRLWKRNDLGILGRCRLEDRPFAHYENNQLDYYYRIQNTRNAYPITSTVQAVLVHDVSHVMGRRDAMLSREICKALSQIEDRPWNTWLRKDPKREFGIRPISPTSLGHILRAGGTGITTHNVMRNNVSGTHVFHKDLEDMLKRYPKAPDLDVTLYTREPRYISATYLKNSGLWGRGRSCGIHYNLGELQDYLVDPWPMLKARESLKQIVYCVGNDYWHKPLSRNAVVKIGFSEDLKNFASRLRHYRCSSHMPANPIVHWAILAPTRLLLEKRLHNIYMDRQVDSVGRGKCGGEMFETSPKRWSSRRMFEDAVKIVESYGHKYKVLKEGDFNKSQRKMATACLWA